MLHNSIVNTLSLKKDEGVLSEKKTIAPDEDVEEFCFVLSKEEMMRRSWKKLLAFTLALFMLLPGTALAGTDLLEEKHQSEEALEATKAAPLDAVKAERGEPNTNTSHTFVVSKKKKNDPNAKEEVIQEFDQLKDCYPFFSDADRAKYVYYITMLKDYDLDYMDHVQQVIENIDMVFRSPEGEPHTMTIGLVDAIFQTGSNSSIRLENVIIDAKNGGSVAHIAGTNSVFTVGKGTTLRNFTGRKKTGENLYLSILGVSDTATLNIEAGSTIENNKSIVTGGVISTHPGATVNIKGGTFKNNTAPGGSVLSANGKNCVVTISGGTFIDNSATSNGGVIWAYDQSTLRISGGEFEKNRSTSKGGVVFADATSQITIGKANFNNNAAVSGGALYLKNGATISNAMFNSNYASSQGGGIYLSAGNLSLDNSTLNQNQAKSGGGALFIAHNGKGETKIKKSTFEENGSPYGGGIYQGINTKLNVSDSSFNKNEAAYGAGLYAASYKFDPKLTNLAIETSTFSENQCFKGGGVFTGIPTSIKKSTFTKNEAILAKGDDKNNPHSSGVGGAINVMDQKTTVEESIFKENKAYGSGGAIGINGWKRGDDGKINSVKPDIAVHITKNSKFLNNTVQVGQGGAIYVNPYGPVSKDKLTGIWESPITDKNAYKPLTTDNTTLFTGNKSDEGLFVPPSNYKDYAAKLAFDANSDVQHGVLSVRSLLNNYDVNYKNPNQVFVTFDANGGQFADKTAKTVKPAIKGEKINLITAPTKDGFTFNGWNTKADGKGTKVDANTVVQADLTVFAQWKKVESKPDPKPDPKPTYPILRIVKIDGDGNRITLPVTFKITDKDLPMLSQQVTTNGKGVAEVHYLTSGDYSLSENKTPDGYIPLDKPLSFSVTDGKLIRYNNDYVRTIYVTNNKKTTPENPSNTDITTIGGKDRKDVATNISKNYFGAAKKIIVVQDMAYADSMSAMNVSQGRYPILYVGKDTLYDETKQEILRTHRDEIIVMGGVNTISNKVYKELVALSDAKVTRVDGVDRYEVNRNSVVRYMPKSAKAVVASGMFYMDALSSVPYAHQMQAPIVLVTKNTVPPVIADLLSKQMKDAIIVGGANTIAPQNKANLEALLGKTIERITGADRYAVSANVSNRLVKVEDAIVTSGEKWSDALVAGPLAQKRNAPVLLTAKKSLPSPIVAYLDTHKNLKSLITVGGSASIGEGVRTQLKALFPVVMKEK